MTAKRGAVVEKVDASQMMPDIYGKWLGRQKSGQAKARSGFIGNKTLGLVEQAEEDREEYQVDRAEDERETAKRRKHGRRTS
jgi:hypothetical protein